ncbi:prenyltransferase [Litchfieldella rifensis]|uniref:Prenyltransferase n=1 Tax=Litchfieldella rifensis TaxID=762643 RepID=A0ABV7LMG7_9GAMM
MSSMAVVRASRPNFLILAPLCVWLGIALAWRQPVEVQGLDIALVMLGALLAHAAINLLNEYQDFHSGLDLMTRRTPFSGGSGALPEEPTAAPRVLATAIAMLAGVVMVGGYFLWLRGLPISIVGLGGLALVVGYTRWITRSPWACLLAPGLGFGPVMVLGTMLALGGSPGMSAILVALVVMLLVSELLLINQFPDVEADRRVGRRHVPVVLGMAAAARIVVALLLGAYLLLVAGCVAGFLPPSGLLALLPSPIALWIAWRLPRVLGDRSGLSRVLGVNVATLLTTLGFLGVGLGWG